MEEWLAILAEKACSTFQEPVSSAAAKYVVPSMSPDMTRKWQFFCSMSI